ncbi:hypothetical protein Tco_0762034 [Tanacetum coccineum]
MLEAQEKLVVNATGVLNLGNTKEPLYRRSSAGESEEKSAANKQAASVKTPTSGTGKQSIPNKTTWKEVQINDIYVGADVGRKLSSRDTSSQHNGRTCQAHLIPSKAGKRAALVVRNTKVLVTSIDIIR